MSDRFFTDPILNSPYVLPARGCELITPIPKPKKRGGKAEQQQLIFQDKQEISDERQHYDVTELINSIRDLVGEWRTSNEANWRVTPETARLLKHWRHHEFAGIRPFFCQVEAVETSIWLTEVAPQIGKKGTDILDELERANDAANPGLFRIAHKLATGAGKTTVMATLIAWQTINAVCRPSSEKFTRGFLVVAPGLTIRDRLRVLQPNDTESHIKPMEP